PSSGKRVYRGGSWGDDSSFVRSSNRVNNSPNWTGYYGGFRVARTP
ncbi:MAG: Sulfatase-modifying factor enzyme 1, partial [Planctomycetota bacterium]